MSYPTLTHVAMEARPYPTHLLEGCETGLVLFAAAFLGHNDAIHFAEAGIPYVLCIDRDATRLSEMSHLYPPSWHFMAADAWEWASETHERFEVVSVDTFTGDAMHRSLASLDLWCSIARRALTVTITDDVESIDVPKGWTSSLYPRSDHVSWLVLERD